MDEATETKRQPIFAIIAAAVLALSLFTPFLLISLPIMVAVVLSIISAFRKEHPKWLPFVVGGLSVLLLIAANSHRSFGSMSEPNIKASEIWADAKWDYGSTKDAMRGTTEPNATLYSPTDLDLPAPYDGTNAASIYVNSTQGIMLTIEKGQFQCNSNDSVALKVDDGPVWNYPCSTSDNGQTNFLFINSQYSPETGQPADPKDILSRGKKLMIEASFYDAGTRQITFNIAGFDPSKVK